MNYIGMLVGVALGVAGTLALVWYQQPEGRQQPEGARQHKMVAGPVRETYTCIGKKEYVNGWTHEATGTVIDHPVFDVSHKDRLMWVDGEEWSISALSSEYTIGSFGGPSVKGTLLFYPEAGKLEVDRWIGADILRFTGTCSRDGRAL
jgi:hypothetical protein